MATAAKVARKAPEGLEAILLKIRRWESTGAWASAYKLADDWRNELAQEAEDYRCAREGEIRGWPESEAEFFRKHGRSHGRVAEIYRVQLLELNDELHEIREFVMLHAPRLAKLRAPRLAKLVPRVDFLNGERPPDFLPFTERMIELWAELLAMFADDEACEDRANGSAEDDLMQLAAAMGAESTTAIFGIARDASLSADKRLDDISKLDGRYFGWDSTRLADLLGNVTPQAIRQTIWWKTVRPKHKAK
jgi:hypothetical protein